MWELIYWRPNAPNKQFTWQHGHEAIENSALFSLFRDLLNT